MKRTISLFLSATLAFASVSCGGDEKSSGLDDIPYKSEEEESSEPSLKDAPYPIGCAVNMTSLNKLKSYRDLVVKEFSSLTPGNEMKMTYILKSGVYDSTTGKWDLTLDYSDADKMINFATANNIRVHGHTLVWFKKVPDCLLTYDGKGRDIWVSFLEEYISKVVGHFKGKVSSWDVVNEAIADNLTSGSSRPVTRAEDMWYKNLGEDYIDLAFQLAHKADPDALLFYNDYGTEYLYYKRVAMVNMAKRMIKAGIPIDGIGLQTHTDICKNPESDLSGRITNIERNIEAVIGCGLKVHVSEIDVKICTEGETIDYDDAADQVRRLEYQAQVYKAVAEKLKSYPSDKVYGMTTWGVQDSGTSGKTYQTLLFDENYGKKKAYYSILETFSSDN